MNPPSHERSEAGHKESKKAIERSLRTGRFVQVKDDISFRDDNNYQAWQQQFETFTRKPDPITIVVNSNGGKINEIWDFYFDVEKFRKESGSQVYTLGDKNVLSAGVDALLIGDEDGIFVTPGTVIQFHGSTDARKFGLSMTEEDFKLMNMFALLPSLTRISGRTRVSISQLREDALLDKQFTAEEAVRTGLVDGIYDLQLPDQLRQ